MVKDILVNLAIVLLPVIAVAVYLGGETVQTDAFLILATFGAVIVYAFCVAIAGVLLMIWLNSVSKLIDAFKYWRKKK